MVQIHFNVDFFFSRFTMDDHLLHFILEGNSKNDDKLIRYEYSDVFVSFRFCGSELPKGGNIISTQNTLYLWFRSDNSSAHDGFELTWNSIDPGNMLFCHWSILFFKY